MERLKQYLKDTKTTQREFGDLMGVSQPTVSDWLLGNTVPTVDKLKEMSNKTGISIDELLDHVPPTARSRSSRATAAE